MIWEFTRRQLLVFTVAFAASGCATLPSLFHRKGDGKIVTTEKGTCTYLSPENQLHPLSACESAAGYAVRVGNQQYVYGKAAFQKNLRERLWQFLRTTNYPEQSLKGATVEVWLEAKVFEPEVAELKVVVIAAGGNFALPLALDMSAWEVLPEQVVRLGQDRYPSRGAKRTGVLALLARSGVTPERLKAFLSESGVLAAKTRAGRLAVHDVQGEAPLLTLSTEPFAEPAVAQQLMAHKAAKSYLNDVRYVQAGEAEGYKARVFSFGW